MVIEHYRPGRAPEIYRRFRERGRMAPEGLRYVASWVGLIDFEIVPVRASAEAAAAIAQP
jgi:hypothetical protein